MKSYIQSNQLLPVVERISLEIPGQTNSTQNFMQQLEIAVIAAIVGAVATVSITALLGKSLV
jgi:hypothetical protein